MNVIATVLSVVCPNLESNSGRMFKQNVIKVLKTIDRNTGFRALLHLFYLLFIANQTLFHRTLFRWLTVEHKA